MLISAENHNDVSCPQTQVRRFFPESDVKKQKNAEDWMREGRGGDR